MIPSCFEVNNIIAWLLRSWFVLIKNERDLIAERYVDDSWSTDSSINKKIKKNNKKLKVSSSFQVSLRLTSSAVEKKAKWKKEILNINTEQPKATEILKYRNMKENNLLRIFTLWWWIQHFPLTCYLFFFRVFGARHRLIQWFFDDGNDSNIQIKRMTVISIWNILRKNFVYIRIRQIESWRKHLCVLRHQLDANTNAI